MRPDTPIISSLGSVNATRVANFVGYGTTVENDPLDRRILFCNQEVARWKLIIRLREGFLHPPPLEEQLSHMNNGKIITARRINHFHIFAPNDFLPVRWHGALPIMYAYESLSFSPTRGNSSKPPSVREACNYCSNVIYNILDNWITAGRCATIQTPVNINNALLGVHVDIRIKLCADRVVHWFNT